MTERDSCTTTITSWVTPGCEKNLRRAADIANEHGYNYLSDEHIVLALLENPWSYLSRHWPDGVTMTRDQLTAIMREHLPPVPADDIGPDDQVRVATDWRGPHAEEIRAQTAGGNGWSANTHPEHAHPSRPQP